MTPFGVSLTCSQRTATLFRLALGIACRLAPACATVGYCSVGSAQSLLPESDIAIRLEPLAVGMNGPLSGNTANSRLQYIPIDMTPLGDGRQLIMSLGGHVRLLGADGQLQGGAYLDTFNVNSPDPNSQDFTQIGNTSIAAHPGFLDASSRGYGKFYTLTSERPNLVTADFEDGVNSIVDSVLYEWTVAPEAIGAATQLTVEGPEANVTRREVLRSARPGIVHTLADMAFTPDEYLLLTSGDGGGNAFPNTEGAAFNQDRFTNAQDPRNIFGSVFRIDPLPLPDDTRPTGGQNDQYYLHPDNFGLTDGDSETHGETFAYGFRSPYRISVDATTGNIYIGDVGEAQREEIDVVENGGNYGWGAYEGTRVPRPALIPGPGEPAAIGPLFELYQNLGGQSEATNIVGGFVYRGSAIPELYGKYVFADTGEDNDGEPTNIVDIYFGDPESSAASVRDDLYRLHIEVPDGMSVPDRIWSMAEDEQGELYLLVGPDRLDLFNLEPGETDGGIWKITQALFQLNQVAGDVNQDGVLSEADVDAFRQGWRTTGWTNDYLRYTNGDLNFDGQTNLDDYWLLYDAFANSLGQEGALALFSGQPAVGVPEPSTLFIGLMAFASLLVFRARPALRARPTYRPID